MGMEIVVEDGVLSKESAIFLQQRNRLARFCAINEVTYREEDLVQPTAERNPYQATQFNSGALPPESQPAEMVDLTDSEGESEEDAEAPAEDEVVDEYDDEEVWSFAELKAEAKSRELPTNGNRAAIIERLREDDATRPADEE